MFVTLSGITIEVIFEWQKAQSPISTTPSGITTSPPLPTYLVMTPSLMTKSLILLISMPPCYLP
jgi:hypothetical protein